MCCICWSYLSFKLRNQSGSLEFKRRRAAIRLLLKKRYIWDYRAPIRRLIRGDTRSLDYSLSNLQTRKQRPKELHESAGDPNTGREKTKNLTIRTAKLYMFLESPISPNP